MKLQTRLPLAAMPDAALIGVAPRAQLVYGHVPVRQRDRPDVVFRQLHRRRPGWLFVAAMPVEQDQPVEAISPDRAGDVTQHLDERLERERDRADLSHVVLRKSQADGWSDDDRKVINCRGRLNCQVVWDADVDILGTVRTMLLDRPDRDDDDRVLRERREQLMPQHLLPQDFFSTRRSQEHRGAPHFCHETDLGSGSTIVADGASPGSGRLPAPTASDGKHYSRTGRSWRSYLPHIQSTDQF